MKMMKPRFYHYAAAYFLPIVAQGTGIIAVAITAMGFGPIPVGGADLSTYVLAALALMTAYALGALLGMVILGRIFYPVVVRFVGGPHAKGDGVIILRGRRHGTVTSVYEVWAERGQVRLKLSDDERDSCADVYRMNEVMNLKRMTMVVGISSGSEMTKRTERG